MKAVVLEIKNGFAAVLSDDGRIVKIKNSHYEIGQQILLSSKVIALRKKAALLVSSAAALILISTGVWTYASPYAYVSLDVNPSIEYSVNRYDRVIHVNAVNADGDAILHKIKLDKLKNRTIIEAVKKTVDEISDAGYFTKDTAGDIVITTSAQNRKKSNELAKDLHKAAVDEVTNYPDKISVEALPVDSSLVEEAHKLGITPGKLHLIKNLQASTTNPSSIHINDWLYKSVKEIKKAINNNKHINNNLPDSYDKINNMKKDGTKNAGNNKNQLTIKDEKNKIEKQVIDQPEEISIQKEENNEKLISNFDRKDNKLKSNTKTKKVKKRDIKTKSNSSHVSKKTEITTTVIPSHKENNSAKYKVKKSKTELASTEKIKQNSTQNSILNDKENTAKSSNIDKQKESQKNANPNSQKTNQSESKTDTQNSITVPVSDESSSQQTTINSDHCNPKSDNNSNKDANTSDQSNEAPSNNGGKNNNSSKGN